jgi:hypothetical protein
VEFAGQREKGLAVNDELGGEAALFEPGQFGGEGRRTEGLKEREEKDDGGQGQDAGGKRGWAGEWRGWFHEEKNGRDGAVMFYRSRSLTLYLSPTREPGCTGRGRKNKEKDKEESERGGVY